MKKTLSMQATEEDLKIDLTEISNADNSILFKPFIISILLSQQKRILTLEKKLSTKQLVYDIPEPEQTQEN